MRRVGRLEHMGYVKRYQERLQTSPQLERAFHSSHRAYAAARWALLSEEDRIWCEQKGYAAVLRDTGVGGIRCFTQVRCLHVHTAHALAAEGEKNIIGQWVLEALRNGEDSVASDYQKSHDLSAAAPHTPTTATGLTQSPCVKPAGWLHCVLSSMTAVSSQSIVGVL